MPDHPAILAAAVAAVGASTYYLAAITLERHRANRSARRLDAQRHSRAELVALAALKIRRTPLPTGAGTIRGLSWTIAPNAAGHLVHVRLDAEVIGSAEPDPPNVDPDLVDDELRGTLDRWVALTRAEQATDLPIISASIPMTTERHREARLVATITPAQPLTRGPHP